MNIVPISVEPMWVIPTEESVLEFIGQVAGECYNSSMDYDRCKTRALNCIKRGHHSPWEHYNLTLKSIVDRGTSHALVRHRHCAFQQSSTIYQSYRNGISIVDTPGMDEFERACYANTEYTYLKLLEKGKTPAQARDVLPTALATGLIITTNIREWMYILHRRDCSSGGEAPRMAEWNKQLRSFFTNTYPLITGAFDEWYEKHPL